MFISSPKKYATGSDKSKAKVAFLESLTTQMDEHQRIQFETAKQIYELALQKVIIKSGSSDTAKVVELLNIAIRDHQILTITYKGFTRDIYPYASDNKYCIAYCTLRHELRTFRIDRMQYVHASGIFNSDNQLIKEAQSKISEAPTFRNYRSYKTY